jgi:hypothetical protein
MKRSTALAAAVVALLIATSAVLANDGPGITFSMTAQEVTAEQAKELAVQVARAAAQRRPDVERPVLVPRHRPLPMTDVARAGEPAAAAAAAAASATQPQSAETPAPTPASRVASPTRRIVSSRPSPSTSASPAPARAPAPTRPGRLPGSITSPSPKPQLPPMNPGVSRELLKDAKQALDRAHPRGEGVAPR